MPQQTPIYGLPYLVQTDPPDIAGSEQALALATEAALGGLDARIHKIEGPAVCRAQFPGAGYPQGANTDVMASSGWTAAEDPLGMFSINGGDLLARMTIPAGYGGRYRVRFKTSATGGGSGARAAYVTLNSTDPTGSASIARDVRQAVTAGADTAWPTAEREIVLAAGDILRWGFWTSDNCTAAVARFGEPSEMYIRRVALS